MLEDEVFCADCGKDLYEFELGYPAVEPHVAYKSLQLSLYGGYGLFFDTDFQTVPEYYDLWLCHDCAHKLVDSSPLLKKLTENGHIEEE